MFCIKKLFELNYYKEDYYLMETELGILIILLILHKYTNISEKI